MLTIPTKENNSKNQFFYNNNNSNNNNNTTITITNNKNKNKDNEGKIKEESKNKDKKNVTISTSSPFIQTFFNLDSLTQKNPQILGICKKCKYKRKKSPLSFRSPSSLFIKTSNSSQQSSSDSCSSSHSQSPLKQEQIQSLPSKSNHHNQQNGCNSIFRTLNSLSSSLSSSTVSTPLTFSLPPSSPNVLNKKQKMQKYEKEMKKIIQKIRFLNIPLTLLNGKGEPLFYNYKAILTLRLKDYYNTLNNEFESLIEKEKNKKEENENKPKITCSNSFGKMFSNIFSSKKNNNNENQNVNKNENVNEKKEDVNEKEKTENGRKKKEDLLIKRDMFIAKEIQKILVNENDWNHQTRENIVHLNTIEEIQQPKNKKKILLHFNKKFKEYKREILTEKTCVSCFPNHIFNSASETDILFFTRKLNNRFNFDFYLSSITLGKKSFSSPKTPRKKRREYHHQIPKNELIFSSCDMLIILTHDTEHHHVYRRRKSLKALKNTILK